MSNATFTFRVDVAQQEDIQQYDAWLTKKVEQSQASAEAGNLISAADVEARFAARRAATATKINISSRQTQCLPTYLFTDLKVKRSFFV